MKIGDSVLARIKVKLNKACPESFIWHECQVFKRFKNDSLLVINNNPLGKKKIIRQFPVKSLFWRVSNHEISPEAKEYLKDYDLI